MKNKNAPTQVTAAEPISWRRGNPPDHGYYLVSWGIGASRTVSELWYNPTNGWWTSRGYLQAYEGQRNWPNQPVPHVYAWIPLPVPATA